LIFYHSIVKAILTKTFADLNAKKIEAVIARFTKNAEHYFIGEHALSGTRQSLPSIEKWYGRLFALFPDIQFQLKHIDVAGMPWHTVATVYWSETNCGTDGIQTTNTGLNVVVIRWGKVCSVRIYTDTQRLVNTLDRLALSGNVYAHATPIVDELGRSACVPHC
jgi:ketosteroid isomerase-like protein